MGRHAGNSKEHDSHNTTLDYVNLAATWEKTSAGRPPLATSKAAALLEKSLQPVTARGTGASSMELAGANLWRYGGQQSA